MRVFLRGLLAIVLGLVMFFVVVLAGEFLGMSIYGIKVDPNDPHSINDVIKTIPTRALVAVVLAWACGAFVGGWVAASLAPARKIAFGLAIGVVGLLITIVNLVSLPHPVWMWVVGAAELVPAAYLGAWLAPGRQPAPAVA